jgi:hypothetical protein
VGDRRPEDRDDGVSDELLYRAAEALELGLRARVIRRKETTNVLGVEPLRASREVDEVDEDRRDDLALFRSHALLLLQGSAAGCAVGELRRDDGAA